MIMFGNYTDFDGVTFPVKITIIDNDLSKMKIERL